ncbi:hypothetical protein AZO1586R_2220 [Bathymodiolus azoricus thioautotrophic gill symbiont]|uniref:Uncharacterized protein n=1 Tax=Bathymodiolus azoricus thioautotrophic gill symbiont TaxID=235205 RepID=A0ACA8ZTD1_9GAMM|nr:hypothetical protein AZO1586R_2220 [Bathymodiolus azoricus thioautotrophic gill symbiont]
MLITIVSLKGFFRQNDVCTEHYLCTNIASVAYRLFDVNSRCALYTEVKNNQDSTHKP